jgi:CheY-like chemotaxis protein
MSTKTVLIVDDEPHIRYLLEMKLRHAGYTVLTATNGDQGYEIAAEHAPDVIVTDFQMPGFTGLELCQKLAANPATAAIPAVMLTARGHRIPAAGVAATNITKMLAKPFSPRELLKVIDALVSAPVVAENEDGTESP